MLYDEKFEKIYSNLLKKEKNGELGRIRKAAKSEKIYKIILASILAVIGLFVLFILVIYFEEAAEILCVFYLVFAISLYIKLTPHGQNSKILQYEDLFKTYVINSFLNSYNRNIQYFPQKKITENIFNEAEFEIHTSFFSSDLICGTLENNCFFEFSRVITRTSSGDSSYENFNGLFARIETPKPFNTKLYLRKDYYNKNNIINNTFISFPFEKFKIDLDSQEFEEYFDVYSENKIIALQLLTSDIMQTLIDFVKKTGIKYEISIKDNYIYIAFRSCNIFESPNFKDFSFNKDKLYEYYNILNFMLSLSTEFINLINETEYD